MTALKHVPNLTEESIPFLQAAAGGKHEEIRKRENHCLSEQKLIPGNV